MICMIQEPQQRLFLSEANTWTSDFNQAREFSSIRESLRHKHALHLDNATVLVFRDKRVYRVEHDEVVPLAVRASDDQVQSSDSLNTAEQTKVR